MQLKEYEVVCRPFYRESQPFIENVFAENEKEASFMKLRSGDTKEILEVKPIGEIVWNESVINSYWNMYK